MTDTVVLKAETRECGTSRAGRTRAKGLVPAVVYGHKTESLPVAVDAKAFSDQLHQGHRVFELELESGRETVMVKDLQYDYLGKSIVHADFLRVDLNERVTVTVALTFKGTPKGTSLGGIFDIHSDEIEIECAVVRIPEKVSVPVKSLDVDSSLHAGDIVLPAGVTLVTDAGQVIATCNKLGEIKTTEELEEESGAGPEVITEKNVAQE